MLTQRWRIAWNGNGLYYSTRNVSGRAGIPFSSRNGKLPVSHLGATSWFGMLASTFGGRDLLLDALAPDQVRGSPLRWCAEDQIRRLGLNSWAMFDSGLGLDCRHELDTPHPTCPKTRETSQLIDNDCGKRSRWSERRIFGSGSVQFFGHGCCSWFAMFGRKQGVQPCARATFSLLRYCPWTAHLDPSFTPHPTPIKPPNTSSSASILGPQNDHESSKPCRLVVLLSSLNAL